MGCASQPKILEPGKVELKEVASSDRQWTGVAVSKKGRIFVNFPRWSDDVPVSVAEVTKKGGIKPFPNEKWNIWDPNLSPEEHFVCVQSVYVDGHDYLWILDAGNPKFQGVIPGGPKLVKVDLQHNEVVKTILFDNTIALPDSYLNDVRVDTRREFAYITDSGAGGIIVVNLVAAHSRRLLENHPSTKSEDIALTIGGREWRRPDGSLPRVHADGIAMDRAGRYLYYQALTGRTLYRIDMRWLRLDGFSDEWLDTRVESLAESGASDGLICGSDDAVYISAIEENAIKRFTKEGRVETLVQDPRLSWPDSFAVDKKGALYVTTSQIHLGTERTEPYKIFKLTPGK